MIRAVTLLTGLFGTASALAAEPVRIGVAAIVSGPTADRGHSEQ